MLLWVGLGNPEPSMQRQRHNIGFMAVDEIARCYGFTPWRARLSGLTSEGTINGHKILLLKPMTYMNRSGESVQKFVHFYKLALDHLVVFHDELDLTFCKTRVKKGGGAAGHNGLRSLDQHLDSASFWRVRLGIGHPGHRDRVYGHVLGDFSKVETPHLNAYLDSIAKACPLLADDKPEEFMTKTTLLVREATHGL